MRVQSRRRGVAGLVAGMTVVAALGGTASAAVGRPIGPGGHDGDGRAPVTTVVVRDASVLPGQPCFIVQPRWNEALNGPVPRCQLP